MLFIKLLGISWAIFCATILPQRCTFRFLIYYSSNIAKCSAISKNLFVVLLFSGIKLVNVL